MESSLFKRYLVAAGLYNSHGKVNRKSTCETLGIAERTLDKYLQHGCNNQAVINHLLTLVMGLAQNEHWQGWRIDSQMIISPHGWRVDKEKLADLWRNQRLAEYNERKIKELEQAIAELHRLSQTSQNKKIASLCYELLDAVEHKNLIYTDLLGITRDNVEQLKAG